MEVKFNLSAFVRSSISTLKPYSSARDEFDSDDMSAILLDANENAFSTGLNRYPDPHQRVLKDKLAEIKQIPTENILLGNGSDEVLDLLFRAFCEPAKSSIITLIPTYGMYDVLSQINAVENIEVPLSSSFQVDVDIILSAVNFTTKMLFICSPNNPSGNTFSEKSVTRLLKEFKGLVIIDEAYIDFSDKESWLKRLGEFPNLVITQTMSKAWGMAGIRLGFCFASPQIISILKKIKPPYNVNELTQKYALKQLNNVVDVQHKIRLLKEYRRLLITALNKIDSVDFIYPSETNFLLARFKDAQRMYDVLRKAGIVVRNRSSLKGCENCLRITVGAKEENEQLIKIIRTVNV
jgi:histidinol-phosphate aminotransferase